MHALEQLQEIRKSESRNLTIDKGLIKIALEVVVFYRASEDPDKLQIDMEEIDLDEIFHEMVHNLALSDKLNLIALWMLNERMVEPVEYPSTFKIYPAVAFLVHISEIID